MKKFILILFVVILSGCKTDSGNSTGPETPKGEVVEIKYAKGFSIEKFDGYSLLKVESPWPGVEKTFRYLLAEKDAKISDNLEFDQKVEVPVGKIVVTSTTHVPALEKLGEEENLIGFPGLDYISSEKTRKRIKTGKITELGKNENINTETLINLQPDVVIGFAIDGNNKTFERIQQTGIPVFFNGDWMEEDPMGKAEWIKFFGVLFGKNEEANRIFNEIDAAYTEAKKLAETAENSPKVLCGSMYRDQWYLPYGNSWQARFVKDANANYAYSHTTGNGSMAVSFESVLDKAHDADFWISAGQFTSYSQLFSETEHYRQFKAVREKNVYGVSLTKGETGGILYFELGPQRPDLVLKDLVSIFHPDLLPDYERIFFKALKE